MVYYNNMMGEKKKENESTRKQKSLERTSLAT